MGKLLTIDANPKTTKGNARGYQTAILHLAPASLSGRNVCPYATEGCRTACLNTAGRGGVPGRMGDRIQAARIRKTREFFADRPAFLTRLASEIDGAIRRASRKGLTPVFRLNGTSDLLFERFPVTYKGQTFANLMHAFPDVQFYDYTKVPARYRTNLPTNYRLTFSLAESNDAAALDALTAGLNVAAVFAGTLPPSYMGRPVINGDETDLRFLDPAGVIVGLKAKGRAKRDTSGFVRA